jgi:hypothetical protein
MSAQNYDLPDFDKERAKCKEFLQNFRDEDNTRKYYEILVIISKSRT